MAANVAPDMESRRIDVAEGPALSFGEVKDKIPESSVLSAGPSLLLSARLSDAPSISVSSPSRFLLIWNLPVRFVWKDVGG